MVERGCGTGDPWRGSVGRLCEAGSCEECQTSEESWSVCVVGYHPLVVKSDGSAGAGGRSTAGVGIKSACSQWSVGRSGLGCLLTAM